jgi:hypothetical protein
MEKGPMADSKPRIIIRMVCCRLLLIIVKQIYAGGCFQNLPETETVLFMAMKINRPGWYGRVESSRRVVMALVFILLMPPAG